MDTIRNDFVAAISLFKDVEYRKYLLNEIELERERNSKLRLQAAELDKDVRAFRYSLSNLFSV